jgi:hypothetical protein
MSQIDLEPDEAVRLAAEWLASRQDLTGRAVIPEIKTRFGVGTAEAIEACRRATLIRNGRAR